MKQPALNEELVRRYLLGELPRRERERLEVGLLTDDRYYQAVTALETEVEDELIDEYLDGELSVTEREDFERVFLQTPERVHKLEVLKVLKEQAVSAAQPEPVPTPVIKIEPARRWWTPILAIFQTPQFGFASVAALMLALFAVGWLWVRSHRLETQLQQASITTDAALRDRVAELSRSNEDLTAKLKTSEETRAGLEQEVASLKGQEIPSPEKPRATFASLTLLPSVRSSSGNNNATLTFLPDQTEAHLTLAVERVDPKDYNRFRAVVKKQSGTEVWRNESVKLHANGDNARAILIIPAAKLPDGQYTGELEGINSFAQSSLLGLYVFRVTHK